MLPEKERKNTYLITFRDHKENKILSLRASSIKDSNLGPSFVAISDLIFQSDSLFINPVEENLKQRFKDTKVLHLSIYSIISIEEVGQDHQGLQFHKDKSNLVILPTDNAH